MRLPPCPHLPEPADDMDAGHLTAHGPRRDADFYHTALSYGHHLWQRGLAARAILKLNRAFGADLDPEDAVLRAWPLPYAALGWILRRAPADVFLGNPRVHFQHLADRMNEPRRDQRRWRAWACWAVTRQVRPDFAGDPRHEVEEPSFEAVGLKLDQHGFPGESDLWRSALARNGE
ncbi:MAG TPA: hypothetical protein VHD32_02860 [Candidatus Didemnitutus sp.]|nr:hypothetical protein [Candidatus Didemnitutus sp.]